MHVYLDYIHATALVLRFSHIALLGYCVVALGEVPDQHDD